MKKAFKSIAVLITFLFILISSAHAAEIAVIVKASGPLAEVTESDIADIYLGEKRFHEGIKIVPLLYPEGPVKERFLKEVLNMASKEYKLYWTKKIFQEGIPIPRTIDSPAEMINMVKGNDGGIGFLPKETLKDLSGLKIIKIIDK